MNRTKLYAAGATGFSTGETVITAWVVIVLLTPMKIPDAMTAGISTARSVVQMAMTSTITANAARLRYMVLAMPRDSCRRGAPNTAKRATMMPQPVNTRPRLIGLRFIGNGAYPRTVQKPQL